MKRIKYGQLPIGQISEGTLLTYELIETMLQALSWIHISADHRKFMRTVKARLTKLDHNNLTDEDGDWCAGTWDEMLQIANEYAPSFTYVGGHEGDPACVGVWIDHGALHEAEGDGCLIRHDAPPPTITDDPNMQQPDYYLQVNDHGNMTLWVKSGKNGRRWSIMWEVV